MYENIQINSLVIQIMKECNLNCKHCFNSQHRNGYMDIEKLEKVICSTLNYGVKEILFSGGEPLLHPEIYQIFNLIKKYPQISFGIITNGILLNEKMISELERIPKFIIQISIDGSKKEIYEAIRGEGIFESFCYGLELLAHSHIKDKRARTAVSKINYRDIFDICLISFQKKLMQSFVFVANLGNAYTNWDELYLNEVQKMHVNYVISNFNKQYGTRIHRIGPSDRCEFVYQVERDHFTIDANGDVLTCNYFYDKPIGNIYYEDWKSVLHGNKLADIYKYASERKIKVENSSRCSVCSIKNVCGYGCLGEMQNGNDNLCDGECKFRKLYYSCSESNLI